MGLIQYIIVRLGQHKNGIGSDRKKNRSSVSQFSIIVNVTNGNVIDGERVRLGMASGRQYIPLTEFFYKKDALVFHAAC